MGKPTISLSFFPFYSSGSLLGNFYPWLDVYLVNIGKIIPTQLKNGTPTSHKLPLVLSPNDKYEDFSKKIGLLHLANFSTSDYQEITTE